MAFRPGGIAAAAVLLSAPLAAQSEEGAEDFSRRMEATRDLEGTWGGTLQEGESSYRILVKITTDEMRRPVGIVRYSNPCTGVWNNAEWTGRTWRFDETIVDGRARCASYVRVELTEFNGGLRVRLRTVGSDSLSVGTIYEAYPESFFAPFPTEEEAAAAAAADAELFKPPADRSDGHFHLQRARCNPGEVGIEFGQARDEQWFIDGEPLDIGYGHYVKSGPVRVIDAERLSPHVFSHGAYTYLPRDNGDDFSLDLIYVLVGAPATQREPGACEFQAYRVQ